SLPCRGRRPYHAVEGVPTMPWKASLPCRGRRPYHAVEGVPTMPWKASQPGRRRRLNHAVEAAAARPWKTSHPRRRSLASRRPTSTETCRNQLLDSGCPTEAVKGIGRWAAQVAEIVRADEQAACRGVRGEDGRPIQ